MSNTFWFENPVLSGDEEAKSVVWPVCDVQTDAPMFIRKTAKKKDFKANHVSHGSLGARKNGTNEESENSVNENDGDPSRPSEAEVKAELIIKTYNEKLPHIYAALEELLKNKREMVDFAVSQVVDVSLALTQELTCATLDVDKTKILEIAKEALDVLGVRKDTIVRINPSIYDDLKEFGFDSDFEKENYCKFISDSSVGPYGCIVEDSDRKVDGDILSRIKKARFLIEGIQE
ncbi:MAG: hypothetical protein JXR91_11190 [Deltaproteobacteria bacterium]|nr:hypothetical protein [Deltaproteobacteria bacterium]